ncbi:TetR/AcrR family transcriptional regulator [Microlunatus aurantiacus]|uniref:TetR/AcrR family transcriptional regulator n=1 Tax=Microlunatus aurantiacus TaxID=446786 RepID=A0ABP7DC03_9ACTN
MGRPKEFDPDTAVTQAMNVFWERGYADTTPQGLSEALGIGKGSLYHAFGGKRQLYDLALQRYLDGQHAVVSSWLESSGPVKDRLRAALLFPLETDLAGLEHRGCLAINSAVEFGAADAEVATAIRSLLDHTQQVLATLVREGQRTGELRSTPESDAVAGLLMTSIVGLRALARVEDGAGRMRAVVDATIDLL